MDYQEFYARLAQSLGSKARQVELANALITRLVYALYPTVLLYRLWRFGFWEMAELVIWPGFGFLLVTGLRQLINQPRPYEAWDIQPLLEKETKGQSMPSRHVFSATVIGTVLLSIHLWLGLVVLLAAVGLSILRVLGGVHYPKDVVAGFLLGIFLGLPVFFW